MAFKIQKAKRENVYVKLALMGASGSGKTYGALKLATGMAEELEKTLGRKIKILCGNTERSRGVYYADQFDYDIVNLDKPYTPEKYIEFIEFAVEEGYDILILDSTSPEWEGEGGCLEIHTNLGGKYQDWAKVTPRHEKFLKAIEGSPIHIIATMRGKDQYDLEKDDNGKLSVKKLGVGAKQREGFEYEFTATFLIDQKSHVAEAQKDNTGIFDGQVGTVLDESYGRKIVQWANGGEAPSSQTMFKVRPQEIIEEEQRHFENMMDTIKRYAMSLNDKGEMDKYNDIVARCFGEGKYVSEATIEDIKALEDVLDELQKIAE